MLRVVSVVCCRCRADQVHCCHSVSVGTSQHDELSLGSWALWKLMKGRAEMFGRVLVRWQGVCSHKPFVVKVCTGTLTKRNPIIQVYLVFLMNEVL